MFKILFLFIWLRWKNKGEGKKTRKVIIFRFFDIWNPHWVFLLVKIIKLFEQIIFEDSYRSVMQLEVFELLFPVWNWSFPF